MRKMHPKYVKLNRNQPAQSESDVARSDGWRSDATWRAALAAADFEPPPCRPRLPTGVARPSESRRLPGTKAGASRELEAASPLRPPPFGS